jgi:hypothetical protein
MNHRLFRSVRKTPGAIALTFTLYGAQSAANVSLIIIIIIIMIIITQPRHRVASLIT